MASRLREAARGELSQEDEETVKLVSNLQKAFKDRGPKGVNLQLENAFLGHLASTISFSKDDYQNQKALADLRYPSEWYPATRKLQRKIILHVGPTNSGKTYHALKRLEEVESGTYAGPLRLLAHEVYTRMNAKGVPCALITGEERRRPGSEEPPNHVSCTVEMIPLHMKMDVCVIDEIQMIGDLERGWAWTQAVLGVRAKELHLCGEARTVPLIRELAASMGDEVEVNHYNRLTSLEMDDAHVGLDFKKLRKGDCIVAFSVMEIHALRQQIQKQTGKKVAIVYGSLPPETRAQQARLFNDPDSGYDVLVASDAIGMGLNLSIKRIIFASVYKFNGFEEVAISIPHLKQIAGRAGRYKTAHEANKEAEQASKSSNTTNIPVTTLEDVASKNAPQDLEKGEFEFAEPKPGGGLVTTIERSHMTFVRKALNAEPEAIKTAGLFPPDPIIERFANYFPPATPFSYILLRLHDISRIHTRFHMCVLKDQLTIADTVQPVEGLSVLDKVTFCAAPANIKTRTGRTVLYNLAKCVADQKNGDLLDIEGFDWSLLDRPVTANRSHLRELEELHKSIVLYLWLSYRFSGVFSTRALAFHAKSVVEDAIEATLNELTKTQMTLKKIRSRERTRVESRAEEFSEELQRAEEADKEQQENQTEEIVVPAGNRYEEADILDGAEDGHEVEPTDVTHEAVLEDVADESTEAEPAMTLKKAGPQEEEDDDDRDWTHDLEVDEGNRRMNESVDARGTDTNTAPGP
ncbi:ATP-dependent RNA helicase SUV3 [Lasiodiplodia hormozganensis]|uniref:RNA helicase n=1 Tax=Lasiodiplodia hormozganensis TaxID=869390 RepID=A0AA40D3Q6_9PEZI|nr:ATP-dependent RNA helicase SUV3 [Lasiodiplodia hormozganensis]